MTEAQAAQIIALLETLNGLIAPVAGLAGAEGVSNLLLSLGGMALFALGFVAGNGGGDGV